MKVLGLITEYNPFHNGHAYHLEASKKETGATHTVAVMSGHFLQRGEPAIFDKWTRAKMAVMAGVDLVLELPAAYSSQSAELFAFGSVLTLDSIRVVDSICFGSESGDITRLSAIAKILENEPAKFQALLKEQLDSGLTFPRARQAALGLFIDGASSSYGLSSRDALAVLKSPNNILSIEYLKNLLRLGSDIAPATVRRIAADYNSTQISGSICSATAIRECLRQGASLESISSVVPPASYALMCSAVAAGLTPVTEDSLLDILSYAVISKSDRLSRFWEVREGMDNKIRAEIRRASSYEELLANLKSKRYTMTAIKRMLMNIVLGIEKEDVEAFRSLDSIPYIRILAFNDNGAKLLKQIKQSSDVAIINKMPQLDSISDDIMRRMLRYDIDSTDIFNIVYYAGCKTMLRGSMDYMISPAYITKKNRES
ncbi:MAG: nucleotidyltransferase [Peptoclostridium sp.]|uniref:nucleotidyltransferase n=1 Tax=Peptoclostridium sp. TaxID=1904860 RepID=UPI00139D982E|nr:nucleotidyltransferase [Peptoclostridium sp.]MZQ76325.1 nucleotidyltransferase [Peptoclostridium sp.]